MADDDGKIVKQEEDYTEEVDKLLPQATSLSEEGKLIEAVDLLLPLEKKSRIAADMKSTSRILVHVVEMCFANSDWDKMAEYIVVFMKRRGQLKKAISSMVSKAVECLESAPDKETKLKMIDTLRVVTAGKIHVEVERARLTLTLAHMKEADGEIVEAAEVLQELQVETYGSMDKREKVEFILEQMRLCLLKKDWIRAGIISKKISVRFFEDESSHDLKLKYYNQMLSLAQNDERYLDMSRYYRAIFDTPRIQEDQKEWTRALQNAVVFLVLAPYDSEQADLLPRYLEESKMEELPEAKAVVEAFLSKEIVPWQVFKAQHSQVFEATGIFTNDDKGSLLWKALENRIVEHNIRILAQYYDRITTRRMAELLTLDENDAEKHLARLVSNGTVQAKIDRPAKVIVFKAKSKPVDILNSWATDLSSLMSHVDKATHLMDKEIMVHKAS